MIWSTLQVNFFKRTSFSQAYPKYNEAKQIYTFMDVVLIEVFMAGKF